MLEQIWKKYLRRGRVSLWSLMAPVLWIASLIYRWGLAKERREAGTPAKADCPVICVGNITVGGTGKTPLVEFIARYLLHDGIRVGIVSSGYKRTSTEPIIDEGYRIQQMGASETGDEVALLASLLPRAMFSIAESKAEAAVNLSKTGSVDIIIVDDGYQHWGLHRDIDIVAFDATVRRRALKPFPLGLLREPLSQLKRADIVVLTRISFARDLKKLRNRIRNLAPKSEMYEAKFRIPSLVGKDDHLPTKYLEDKSVFLFAGVGNFKPLQRQVEALAADVDGVLELSDHQDYDTELLEQIKELADNYDSDVILTTGKDWVKLGDFDFDREIYYLAQSVDLDPGEEKLVGTLQKRLGLVRQTE